MTPLTLSHGTPVENRWGRGCIKVAPCRVRESKQCYVRDVCLDKLHYKKTSSGIAVQALSLEVLVADRTLTQK